MNHRPDLHILAEIKEQLDACPYGGQTALMEQYARSTGRSAKTLYRLMKDQFGAKRRRIKGEPKVDQFYVDVIAGKKAFALKRYERNYTTEDAIKDAENEGLVPQGLLVPGTVDRRIRESGYWDERRHTAVLEDIANEVHYWDFSRSEYIYPCQPEGDDWLLVLGKKSLMYKNRQGEKFGMWVGAVRDGKTGVRITKYNVAAGESVRICKDLLRYVWQRPADDHPLHGIPWGQRSDKGSAIAGKLILSLFEELDIKYYPNNPGNKKAMGKIERLWRTWWQRFELPLIMRNGEGYKLRLSELNELAFEHNLEEMNKKHPFFTGLTKRQVFEQDLIAYPPRTYSGDLEDLMNIPFRRIVDGYGNIMLEHERFNVPNRYRKGDAIWLSKSLTGGIECEGEKDGMQFTIRETWKPNSIGEFSRDTDTYQERMAKIEDRRIDGNRFRMPAHTKAPEIVPKSVAKKEDENRIFTADQAKLYITNQLHLDSYADVAQWFDPLLEQATDKESIDIVINVFKRKAN